MSDNPRTDDSLPLSLTLHRNQLCNRFKAAWQAAGAIRSRTPEGTAGFAQGLRTYSKISGGDQLAAVARAQGLVGVRIDLVVDHLHGSIAEQEIHASLVIASGGVGVENERVVGQVRGASVHRRTGGVSFGGGELIGQVRVAQIPAQPTLVPPPPRSCSTCSYGARRQQGGA